MKLEEEVVKKLKECNCLLTTAESCTGGMVASSIVNVSGASEIFHWAMRSILFWLMNVQSLCVVRTWHFMR